MLEDHLADVDAIFSPTRQTSAPPSGGTPYPFVIAPAIKYGDFLFRFGGAAARCPDAEAGVPPFQESKHLSAASIVFVLRPRKTERESRTRNENDEEDEMKNEHEKQEVDG